MKKRKKFLILLPILLVLFFWSYSYIQTRSQADPNSIRVSGNIEVTHAEVSFKISGRVEKRLVSEGEIVEAGQMVALLNNTELVQEVSLRKAEILANQAVLAEFEAGSRPEEIAQADALAKKAQARLAELRSGSRPQEIASAEASLQRAKADAGRLKSESDRQENLYSIQLISARDYDFAQTAYQMAMARVKEEEERLKLIKEGPRKEEIEQALASFLEAKERLNLIKKGPRKETIDQARARLQQSGESLALAETRLGYATLVSPLSGVVLSENIEAGEYIAPGTPVVTVGDLDNVWLRAYISETDLGRVKVGQKVRITTDTYKGKVYEGQISFIASQAEFTPKNVQTEKERIKLVYRVKVDIPNPNMVLKPGMPADAEIMLN